MSKNHGACPVCAGTGRMPCPDNDRPYAKKNGWFGYDANDDTVDCKNCGAQYMFGRPTGQVPLCPDGTPCKHEYKSSAGPYRCTTNYTCAHCGDKHMIDSGD